LARSASALARIVESDEDQAESGCGDEDHVQHADRVEKAPMPGVRATMTSSNHARASQDAPVKQKAVGPSISPLVATAASRLTNMLNWKLA
jgi:hypothetical protein